jgi:hypothetical protein
MFFPFSGVVCASESFEAEKELEGKMESLGNGRKEWMGKMSVSGSLR